MDEGGTGTPGSRTTTPQIATPTGGDGDGAGAGAPHFDFSNDSMDPTGDVNRARARPQPGQPGQPPRRAPGRQKGSGRFGEQNPEELADAVAAAGVNIRAEEEAMMGGLQVSRRQISPNNFLRPAQVAWFMNKTMEDQGLRKMEYDEELINLMSSACEQYVADVVTDLLVVSRHRRRGLRTKQKQSAGGTKSDISRALRDIATKQKEREEKRLKRRMALGLDEDKKEGDLIAEHKQTNITASLMMSGSKKKYSWMQSSSKADPVTVRGDNGIRYREAREEQSLVLRDLLLALEKRRIGVNNAMVKGYAKLKD
ncbi:hypothetical protein OGAPHI_003727 [Ogataea philodendri]|uniref:Transcription initiation factor TFIID subunit 4 n=1 Tax=Ogataea philodendri TaxID=1378263 RepID=A0A9P8T547_9ASCO|nr:uncharacterized protein OGAPHI_003727 [Ogataea philodendri]KAH3665541.1 hypothetical protein OGAPHI_003727 [Ogataea philodendri]